MSVYLGFCAFWGTLWHMFFTENENILKTAILTLGMNILTVTTVKNDSEMVFSWKLTPKFASMTFSLLGLLPEVLGLLQYAVLSVLLRKNTFHENSVQHLQVCTHVSISQNLKSKLSQHIISIGCHQKKSTLSSL